MTFSNCLLISIITGWHTLGVGLISLQTSHDAPAWEMEREAGHATYLPSRTERLQEMGLSLPALPPSPAPSLPANCLGMDFLVVKA